MEYIMMIFDGAGRLVEWATTNDKRSTLLVVFVLVIGLVFLVSRSPRH